MLLDKVDDACRRPIKQEEDWPNHRALRYTKSQQSWSRSSRPRTNVHPTITEVCAKHEVRIVASVKYRKKFPPKLGGAYCLLVQNHLNTNMCCMPVTREELRGTAIHNSHSDNVLIVCWTCAQCVGYFYHWLHYQQLWNKLICVMFVCSDIRVYIWRAKLKNLTSQ